MGRRDYPDRPLVGAGAVIVRGDQVVLVRRGRPPLAGEWSIPGGVVKLGETLRQAADRIKCKRITIDYKPERNSRLTQRRI